MLSLAQGQSQNVAVQTDHQDQCEDLAEQIFLSKEEGISKLFVLVYEYLDNACIYVATYIFNLISAKSITICCCTSRVSG